MKNIFLGKAHKQNELSIAIIAGEGEDLTRGDLQGPRGIARAIQNRVPANIHEITPALMTELYPNSDSYGRNVWRYYEERSVPDIVLSSQAFHAAAFPFLTNPKFQKSLLLQRTNETRSQHKNNDLEIVAHHITPTLLDEQGALLQSHYPEIEGNLIALMLVSKYQVQKFATQLMATIEPYKETTVFVCTCRRTMDNEYTAMIDALEASIQQHEHLSNVKIRGYNLNRERKNEQPSFNPYLGLIAKADHLIMLGNSSSILSEMLASGKSAYTDYAGGKPNLLRGGFIKDISECLSNHRSLQTTPITPPNITQDIADQTLQQFYRKRYGLMGVSLRRAKNAMGFGPA